MKQKTTHKTSHMLAAIRILREGESHCAVFREQNELSSWNKCCQIKNPALSPMFNYCIVIFVTTLKKSSLESKMRRSKEALNTSEEVVLFSDPGFRKVSDSGNVFTCMHIHVLSCLATTPAKVSKKAPQIILWDFTSTANKRQRWGQSQTLILILNFHKDE